MSVNFVNADCFSFVKFVKVVDVQNVLVLRLLYRCLTELDS